MELRLRELGAADKDAVRQLFTDVFTKEPWYDDWSDENQLAAYLHDLTGQSNSLTLGLYEGDTLVGLSMGRVEHWYSGTEYCIKELCVARERQGKGLGSVFLRQMYDFLAKHDIIQIFLQTERSVPAYRFYLKNGFTELTDNVSFAKTIL